MNCGKNNASFCDGINGAEHLFPVTGLTWNDTLIDKGIFYDYNALNRGIPYPGDNSVQFTSHQISRMIDILDTGIYTQASP